MQTAETLIVGGGPAGLATALFLAAERPEALGGLVVLEKAHYPRDKPCAGALGARGDALLERVGVVVDVPSQPLGALAFRAMGETRLVRRAGLGRVVRRVDFDHALAEVARSRGIRVVEGARVSSVDQERGGVLVQTSVGAYRARWVIGADGVGSVVRRYAGVEATPYHAQAVEVDTEPVAADLPPDALLFDASRRDLPGYEWAFPTPVAGRTLMSRGVYALTRGARVRPPEPGRVLDERLAALGLNPSDYPRRRYAERGFGRAARLSSGRLMLVGEAAGIDPVTGEGIAQALGFGAAAGAYLARKLERAAVSLDDWEVALSRTSVGRDLRVRSLAAPLFYGSQRAKVERFFLDTPDFLRVGLAHFAGQRWPRGAVLRAGAAGALALARGAFAFSVRGS